MRCNWYRPQAHECGLRRFIAITSQPCYGARVQERPLATPLLRGTVTINKPPATRIWLGRVMSTAWRLFMALALATPLYYGPPASALPLTLQARSRITVTTERSPDGLRLKGQLLDDADRPVVSETIRVTVTGLTLPAVSTDTKGRFEYFVPVDHLVEVQRRHGNEVPWSAQFLGDLRYGATVSKGQLDLRRIPTRIDLQITPQDATVDTDWVMVRAALTEENRAVPGAPVKLRVADGVEQQGRTDLDGVVRFRVRPADLSSLGQVQVRARFSGDHRRAATETTGTFRVRTLTRVTLRVGREGSASTGRYRFSGRLAGADGPISNGTIAVVVTSPGDRDNGADTPNKAPEESTQGEQPGAAPALRTLAVTTTNAKGVFLTAIPARELFKGAQGVMELRAYYQPQAQTEARAQSRVVLVPVPSPPGIPTRWYLAAILWVLAGLAATHVVRHRLWRNAIAALRKPRLKPAKGALPPGLQVPDPTFIVDSPIAPHAARVDVVAGRVVDAHSAEPVVGALVALRLAPASGSSGNAEVRTDGQGGFELPTMSPGRYTLLVQRSSFVERSVVISLPHSGNLDGATLTLVAVRRRLRDQYRSALARFRAEWTWGRRTPGEVLTQTEAEAGVGVDARPALRRLKELTERAWYTKDGGEHPDTLEAAELLASIADNQRERDAGGR